ncbi:hypothetical protein ACFZC5_32985 [Nocardia gamkensis]|uniref:hypothetical protein n=1 Tax=Nocardia gamkensis TaxID=352869 RepID=UPI0036EAD444
MTDTVSRMIVERVDFLPTRAQWVFVTGTLSGAPVHIGDTVAVEDADQRTVTTIKSIEIHSPPGKTTIALDVALRPLITTGTVISRQG